MHNFVKDDVADTKNDMAWDFDILSLFGKEKLENIQQKISKVSGLAFVTVDYKGEPVTDLTSFTDFCRCVRSTETSKRICMSSDAYGSIQSAVTCKTHIYRCPCGLTEIAIPIIIKGHYLGGFVGGQIRCEDAPSNIASLENVMKHMKNFREDEHMMELYNQTKVMPYEDIVSVAELVSLVIMQMAEKEMSKLQEKELMDERLKAMNRKNKLAELEKNLKEAELRALKEKTNPHFLYNCLNSISNLAVIENAEKTNEMTVLFANYLRNTLNSPKRSMTIREEIDRILQYLKIQKIRLGDRLQFSVNIAEGLEKERIPYHILMPFVENAVLYGILPSNEGGEINIDAQYEGSDILVTVSDTGCGMESKTLSAIYNTNPEDFGKLAIGIGISNTRKRLTTAFGDAYDIIIKSKRTIGTKAVIRYPKDFSEESI